MKITAPKVRKYQIFSTNIVDLPEGVYLTEIGYSQTYPWKVIKTTPRTLTLQRVATKRHPDWQPEFVPGGFCAHCANQNQQFWLYEGLGEETIRVRLNKSNSVNFDVQWSHKGTIFVANGARYFYDYNF